VNGRVNLTYMTEARLELGDVVLTPLKRRAVCIDPHAGDRATFLYEDDCTTVDLHPGHVRLISHGD
jgi:hypothetical protein